ncbi:hypothetical protein KKA27_03015 [Patescibacteria group bacterium]|nr:hypothetical protein [Patescibacteria group bacterium]
MDFKSEVNGFKFNIEKGADEMIFGVKKEQHNVNFYYEDNSQINFNIPSGGWANIKPEVIDQRVKEIIEEKVRRTSEEIKQLQKNAFAKHFVSTTGTSLAISGDYIITGDAKDIKIVEDIKIAENIEIEVQPQDSKKADD